VDVSYPDEQTLDNTDNITSLRHRYKPDNHEEKIEVLWPKSDPCLRQQNTANGMCSMASGSQPGIKLIAGPGTWRPVSRFSNSSIVPEPVVTLNPPKRSTRILLMQRDSPGSLLAPPSPSVTDAQQQGIGLVLADDSHGIVTADPNARGQDVGILTTANGSIALQSGADHIAGQQIIDTGFFNASDSVNPQQEAAPDSQQLSTGINASTLTNSTGIFDPSEDTVSLSAQSPPGLEIRPIVPAMGIPSGSIEGNSNEGVGPKILNRSKSKNIGPPGFLSLLVLNFDDSIVSYLDYTSQVAIQEQREIEDPSEFGHVKTAIVDQLLKFLLKESDSETIPCNKFFEAVVDILGSKYPQMFREDPYMLVNGVKIRKFHSRGTGGVNGIRGNASIISKKLWQLKTIILNLSLPYRYFFIFLLESNLISKCFPTRSVLSYSRCCGSGILCFFVVRIGDDFFPDPRSWILDPKHK
jgi:hypothetical protein